MELSVEKPKVIKRKHSLSNIQDATKPNVNSETNDLKKNYNLENAEYKQTYISLKRKRANSA